MSISLYDASVALFSQTLGALDGILGRGLAHCQDNGVDPAEFVETRFYGDMAPFRYQVQAAIGHSVGAIEGVKAGVFSPSRGDATADYASLQASVGEAVAALKSYRPEEINALAGRPVVFKLGEMTMPFLAEGFLMTFSLPNLHFHTTTAYDILRSKGVPLGKRDYMGRLKLNIPG
jgi:hypothetical protein